MRSDQPRIRTLETTLGRFHDWLEQATEGRECAHPSETTASGVEVCVDARCIFAQADRLLVQDYGTALPECQLWKAKAALLDVVLPAVVKRA